MARLLSVFGNGPQGAHGNARDLRVRWALEEAGFPYETRTIDFASHDQGRAAGQPFGQIPAYQDGDIHMFETGAIVLHVGETSEVLLPAEPPARARAVSWLFAALNTVEMATWNLVMLRVLKPAWGQAAEPGAADLVRKRLRSVSDALGDNAWLEGRFTVGDLMMVSVLRHISPTGIVDEFPNLAALKARAEARPAFQRALAAQLADFA